MSMKEHLIIEGLQKIIDFKASMNLGLSNELANKLAKKFPKINPVARPILENQSIKDPN